MAESAKTGATYEDLCRVPNHLVAQIIYGQLITLPRPSPKHVRATSIMGGKLVPAYDEGTSGPGDWWILDEPELHLDQQILVPDLAGWRRERIPTLPEIAYFELAPDWVCEVLAPSTTQMDRVDKLPIYAAYGVAHAWLVEITAQTMEVFVLQNKKWLLESVYKMADDVRAPPFEALAFNLQGLWS